MTNVNCRNYNQYYDDIINDSGQIDPNKCFNGSLVYQNVDNYHFNDFLNYKSKDYYDFINKNFDRYSFPENYSDLTYEQICEQQKYSLKPQQNLQVVYSIPTFKIMDFLYSMDLDPERLRRVL